jgi:hypothetical protein
LSVRRECADRLLIFSQRHLEAALKIYTSGDWSASGGLLGLILTA